MESVTTTINWEVVFILLQSTKELTPRLVPHLIRWYLLHYFRFMSFSSNVLGNFSSEADVGSIVCQRPFSRSRWSIMAVHEKLVLYQRTLDETRTCFYFWSIQRRSFAISVVAAGTWSGSDGRRPLILYNATFIQCVVFLSHCHTTIGT